MRIEDTWIMHDGHDLPGMETAQAKVIAMHAMTDEPAYDMQTEGNEGEACIPYCGETFEQAERDEAARYKAHEAARQAINIELDHLRDNEDNEPQFHAKEQALFHRLNALFCGE